jgi:hypothetical protein
MYPFTKLHTITMMNKMHKKIWRKIKGIPVPAFHQMARVHQNYHFAHGLLPPTNPFIVTFITQIHVQTAKIYSKTEKISTVFSL